METDIPDRKEIDKECRQVKIVYPIAVSKPLFDCKRFSKWKRVIRITSYIKRFIQNCRTKCGRNEGNQQPEVGPLLTNQELEYAEEYWLKQMQLNLLKRLPRGDFKTLSPYKDDRNILRVGGRVDPTLFSYDERRPALLPYDHHLSTLIVRDAHETSHSGVATTVYLFSFAN
jgi:hypothetical protein